MKRVIFALLAVVFICSIANAKYSGGSGGTNDPYQIANVADLLTLGADANDCNKCFIMTADIDLDPCLPGGQVFTTALIAPDMNNATYYGFDGNSFSGAFDGAGHKIINLTIDTNGTGNDFLGLFGYVNGGEIKNLGLEYVKIISSGDRSTCCGALAGRLENGVISNCFSTGDVHANTTLYSWLVGGLVGENGDFGNINNTFSTCNVRGQSGSSELGVLAGRNSGTISYCVSSGTVAGDDSTYGIGGLVGLNGGYINNCSSTSSVTAGNASFSIGGFAGTNDGIINDCFSTGSVSGGSYIQDFGGFVGMVGSGSINQCYSTGTVSAGDYSAFDVGGFAGALGEMSEPNISNCYSTGDVRVNESLGGLGGFIGQCQGNISNCYSTGDVNFLSAPYGDDGIGGFAGLINFGGDIVGSFFLDSAGPDNDLGIPLSDAQMKQQASFIGWDFNDVWKINEGVDYPKLIWWNKYSGGSGEPDDPYQIANVSDLLTLAADANDYNKCFIMTADIDLDPNLPGNQVFTTALIARDINNANYDFDGNAFTGVFDGAGNEIINLTIDTNGVGNDYLGLFGDIYSGEVKNLHLLNVSITGDNYSRCIGGLAGQNDGSINNCFSTGGVHSGFCYTSYFGGLVGTNYGNVNNSYSTCNVVGGGYASTNTGGLVAYNYGNITHSFATGTVSSSSSNLGGLVATNPSGGTISDCYSTGDVNGGWYRGGLAGINNGSIINSYSSGNIIDGGYYSYYLGGLVGNNDNGGNISNCYSTGSVAVGNYIGGLVGSNDGMVAASFWDVNTSGKTTSAGGTGKTTAEMQTQSTFTDAGWDFVGETTNGPNDIWTIKEDVDYPKLVWPLVNMVGWYEVDFCDFAAMANWWGHDDCAANDDCDGADFDFSGTLDIADMAIMCNYWLQE